MYVPADYLEVRKEVLHGLLAEHPLGILIAFGPDGLTANHIPFLLDPNSGTDGTLIGHVARNNEVWRRHNPDIEALVVFQGPAAYISPNWYATKQETHQVVPTYNYAVVHAYGPIIVHEDAKWLRGVVGKLTKRMEGTHQPVPWKMSDAPADFLDDQLARIVGIEIPLSRMIGKWKISQNRILADREGVVAGLRATKEPGSAVMADLVEESILPK